MTSSLEESENGTCGRYPILPTVRERAKMGQILKTSAGERREVVVGGGGGP